MLARYGDRQRRHQLEARDPIAQRRAQIAEQTHARCDVRHGGKRRDARARGREELQHGGRHDPQRSLGADEELLQIVAGVVLAQSAQTVPDAAVGKHDFDAQHELARVAEAKHRGAAGVGREIAADRAAPFGCERQRKEQPACRRRLAGRRRAARRLRPSASRCRDRRRARGSSARATARSHCPERPGSRRRTVPCFRLARRSGRAKSAQARTTAATSSVLPGRTTASARPWKRPRQSVT